jgi:hypothetical protein
MRRFALIALAALLPLGFVAAPVSAGKGWCRSDPIVALNGVNLQFWIAIPLENQSDVVGPISITFLAPRSTKLALVSTDPGFNGYSESIQLAGNGGNIAADGSFNVKVMVSVPLRGNQIVPLQVQIIPDAGGSVYVEGDATGVSMTLTLLGPAISQTQASSGAVVTYDTESTSVTTESNPDATPTPDPTEESTVDAPAAELSAGGNETAGQTTIDESTAPSDTNAESTATPAPTDDTAVYDGNATGGDGSVTPTTDQPANADATETPTDDQPTQVADEAGDTPSGDSSTPTSDAVTDVEAGATVVAESFAADETSSEQTAADPEPTAESDPSAVSTEAAPEPEPTAEATDTPATTVEENSVDTAAGETPTDSTNTDTADDSSGQTANQDPTADVLDNSTSDTQTQPDDAGITTNSSDQEVTPAAADESTGSQADEGDPTPTPSPTATSSPTPTATPQGDDGTSHQDD